MAIEPETLRSMITGGLPDAQVHVMDETGTGDHFRVEVISKSFKGKQLIEQHRMVKTTVQSAYDDGRLHALAIKTRTPD